jgi:glycosyltransferase involved in cell wall biosynthesis
MSKLDIHLVLFLSRATALKRWEKMGILERELAIYRGLSGWVSQLSIISSGGKEELLYQKYIPGAVILYNRWALSPNIYSLLVPWLHANTLKKAGIYKTNQLDGAWSAVMAGKFYHKPVMVRIGYLWAETNRFVSKNLYKNSLIDKLQAFSISKADALIVTTDTIKRKIIENYPASPKRVYTIPNTVDIELFKPLKDVKPITGRVCFVGRLVTLKNIDMLIEALSFFPQIQLVLIGEGEELPNLLKLAQTKKVHIQYLGQIPNWQIPIEINRSQIFILPSSSEGHPKALIEAMACGAAVIGTDVPGIREIIIHGKTGWLSPVDIDSLKIAINSLLVNPSLRSELGRNARQFICDNYSLEQITELEKRAILQTFQELNNRKHE